MAKLPKLSPASDWNKIMQAVQKASSVTGHGLVISADYSYWNKEGDSIVEEEFGGYETPENIVEAVNAMAEAWNKSI